MSSEPTAEELAQRIADFFKPPYRAEDWEYVRGEDGKIELEEGSGFRKVRYFERDYMDKPDSPAMTTFRHWDSATGDAEISTRALSFLEISEAILTNYRVEKKT